MARLRYSSLPETASIFPHPLLDSALLKMCAAASDALVQRTLHPPRIPRKPAATGQSGGSSSARSGQAGTSGASQAQKQSSSFSPSGQSGQRKKKGKGKAPFPLPPEVPAAQEVKVKEPERSLPDGVPLPVRVGGCLARH